jgi:hypothetical protein
VAEITPLYLETSAAFKLILSEVITIVKKTNISSRLRSLDAIHFSTFLSYTSTLPKTILISADASLIQLADEYKMNVFNPEVEV